MAKFSLPAYDRTTLPNVLAALLMVLVMALMFLPYFDYGTEAAPATASIHDYLWFPNAAPKLATWMKKALDTKVAVKINVVVVEPLLMIFTGVLGFFFCMLKADRRIPSLFPIAFGVLGILAFGFSEFWKIGMLCSLFLWLSVAVLVLGIASIVILTLDK